MAYKIKWSPRAASNFEDICNYVVKDSEYYAPLFAKKVNALISAIPQSSKLGESFPNTEMKIYGKKIYESYRIAYRIKEDFIEIVAICHGSKPLD